MVSYSYRVKCKETISGWAWDVVALQFYSAATQVHPLRAIDSGNAGVGFGPGNAVTTEGGRGSVDRPWGGREDRNGHFWIGGAFSSDAKVTSVRCGDVAQS